MTVGFLTASVTVAEDMGTAEVMVNISRALIEDEFITVDVNTVDGTAGKGPSNVYTLPTGIPC